jgi:hypothetical protein
MVAGSGTPVVENIALVTPEKPSRVKPAMWDAKSFPPGMEKSVVNVLKDIPKALLMTITLKVKGSCLELPDPFDKILNLP